MSQNLIGIEQKICKFLRSLTDQNLHISNGIQKQTSYLQQEPILSAIVRIIALVHSNLDCRLYRLVEYLSIRQHYPIASVGQIEVSTMESGTMIDWSYCVESWKLMALVILASSVRQKSAQLSASKWSILNYLIGLKFNIIIDEHLWTTNILPN